MSGSSSTPLGFASLAELQREVLATLPGFTGVVDADNRFVWCNDEGSKHSDEVVGRTVLELCGEGDAAALSEMLDKARREPEALSAVIQGPSEQERWFALTVRRLEAPVGYLLFRASEQDAPTDKPNPRTPSIVPSSSPLPEIVAMRRELEESQQRLALAMDAAALGIWTWDATSDVVEWDETTRRLFRAEKTPDGYDETLTLIHPDDRDRVHAHYQKAFDTKVYGDIEHRVGPADDTERWLLCRGRVNVGDDGEPTGFAGVVFDVTETKALQEQLRQAQRLEAVGQLAGGVAHDFNNLILAISMNADMARDAPDLAATKQAISDIKQASLRASALTRRLLVFSRQQPTGRKVIDLNELVADVEQLLRRLMPEHIRLSIQPAEERALVSANASQMEQVLVNLAVNARDAMPDGGELTLRLEHSTPQDHDPHVRLSVTDTGTGISPQVRAKVFEPFFTTKEAGKGTGLGLAIVYGVVRQHHGFVEVESNEGGPTRFDVYLPKFDGPLVDEKSREDTRLGGGHETLLIAEDDRLVRTVLRRALRYAGYEVLSAENGKEAVDLFQDAKREGRTIALAILDVVMPEMGGYEALKLLREDSPNLPVILCSGYDAAGPEGAPTTRVSRLQKPYESQELLNIVRRMIDELPTTS